jgi:TetR/AcrR family transcriptional repressor of nem operon
MATLATGDRILAAAQELFHQQGYEATSVDQVLKKAGANSGSLYYYFANKEALLLGVLDRYLAGLWPIIMTPPFSRTDDPIDRVFEVLADYRERVRATGFTYTCPIGSLALEVGHVSPRARKKIAENFAQWRDAIRSCFDAAGDRLSPEVDRAGLAALVLAVMEGAVMQARTDRSLEPFDASVAQLSVTSARSIGSVRSKPRIPIPNDARRLGDPVNESLMLLKSWIASSPTLRGSIARTASAQSPGHYGRLRLAHRTLGRNAAEQPRRRRDGVRYAERRNAERGDAVGGEPGGTGGGANRPD